MFQEAQPPSDIADWDWASSGRFSLGVPRLQSTEVRCTVVLGHTVAEPQVKLTGVRVEGPAVPVCAVALV